MQNRDELPRVSIGSVQDWQKVRSNYKDAALSKLSEMVSSKGLAQEQDAILFHLEQVSQRRFLRITFRRLLLFSLSNKPSISRSPIFASMVKTLNPWTRTAEVL